MNQVFTCIVIAILGNGLISRAEAQAPSGFYLGASAGQASAELDDVAFDERHTGFKLFGGYSFNEHVGFEVAWFDGGHMKEAQRASPSQAGQIAAGGPIHVDVDVSGLYAQAIARLPLENGLALFGKLGAARLAADVFARIGDRVLTSEDDTEEAISYGVGGERRFGRLGVRVEFEVHDASAGEFTLLSVGAQYQF